MRVRAPGGGSEGVRVKRLIAHPLTPLWPIWWRRGLALAAMVRTCAHTGCGEPVAGEVGRYCDQHALELAIVLATLDEMRHVPGETPD